MADNVDIPNEGTGEHVLRCSHGMLFPVVCPQCDPEAYARARPQAERILKRMIAEGRGPHSL